MYIYNIGYHSYEESEYIQIYHQKKFNDKEFGEIVMRVVVNILNNQKKTKTKELAFKIFYLKL